MDLLIAKELIEAFRFEDDVLSKKYTPGSFIKLFFPKVSTDIFIKECYALLFVILLRLKIGTCSRMTMVTTFSRQNDTDSHVCITLY